MNNYKNIGYLVLFLVLLLGFGYMARYLPGNDPLAIDLHNRLSSPDSVHFFGTDELGRDIFARVLTGFGNTVAVAVFAFVTSFIIGVIAGGVAGYYYDTLIDRIFNWVVSIIYSIPFLLTIIAFSSVMERNILNAYLVLTMIIWAGPARIVRAGVIKAASSDFVTMERALGKSEVSILFKSLVPFSLQPAFIFSFKYFPEIVGLEAGLTFLGLGIQPPHPGLGKMIFDGSGYLYTAWWYAFFPAITLFLLVLISNLFITLLERVEK